MIWECHDFRWISFLTVKTTKNSVRVPSWKVDIVMKFGCAYPCAQGFFLFTSISIPNDHFQSQKRSWFIFFICSMSMFEIPQLSWKTGLTKPRYPRLIPSAVKECNFFSTSTFKFPANFFPNFPSRRTRRQNLNQLIRLYVICSE